MAETFQRWYDIDEVLSEVVHTMERMSFASQLKFASLLLELSERLLEDKGGERYVVTLDTETQKGLEKSLAKRRWYDRYPTLFRAFNNLYILSNADRKQLAQSLVIPCRIVEMYEQYCDRTGRDMEPNVIQEILRTSLVEGPHRALKLYNCYMTTEAV